MGIVSGLSLALEVKCRNVADGKLAKEWKTQCLEFGFAADSKKLVLAEGIENAIKLKAYAVSDWKEDPAVTIKLNGYAISNKTDADTILAIKDNIGIFSHTMSSGKEALIYKTENTSAYDPTISPCGRYLLVRRQTPNFGNNRKESFELVDLTTGAPILKRDEIAVNVEFSPDSKYVLFNTLAEYKVVELATLKECRFPAKEETRFSPGGTMLARSSKYQVQLLHVDELFAYAKVDTLKKLPKIPEQQRADEQKKQFLARQKAEMELLAEHRKKQPGVKPYIAVKKTSSVGVGFSPVAPLFASMAGNDLEVWNLKEKKLVKAFPIPHEESPINPSICFSADGKLLAFGTPFLKAVHVFNVMDFTLVKVLQVKRQPGTIAFSADSKYLFMATDEGFDVKYWDTQTWSEHKYNGRTEPDWMHFLAADGYKIMKTVRRGIFFVEHDLASGAVKESQIQRIQFPFSRTYAAHSHDGRLLAFEAYDGKSSSPLWLLECQTGKIERMTDEKDLFLNRIKFSPDGKHLLYSATLKSERLLRLIDLATKKVVWEQKADPLCVDFSAGAVFLAMNAPEYEDGFHILAIEDLIAERKK